MPKTIRVFTKDFKTKLVLETLKKTLGFSQEVCKVAKSNSVMESAGN